MTCCAAALPGRREALPGDGVYLHVTLEVKASGLARFNAVMAEAVPILESEGWVLFAALVQRTGRLNTVIDVWRLDGFDDFDAGLQAFIAHPRFAAIKAVLAASSARTIVFASAAPYMR